MASIRTRTRKDESVYHSLLWREDGRQRSLSFNDLGEAERWRLLLEANGDSMTAATEVHENSLMAGPTVAEAIEHHINQLVDVTPYTIKRYRGALRNHFNGPLGNLKVAGLSHADIVAWIKWMQARGKSPKTIMDKHGLLSAALLTQVRAGTLAKNPCDGIRLPKKRRVGNDGDDIDMDDFRAIRERMDPHFHPFVDFLVGSGCRFSEASALVGTDFALGNNPPLVFITKAHKLGGEGEGRYVGEPKSEKSRRRVSLAPSTTQAIAPLVAQALKDGGPVFRMKKGGAMDHQAFYNRAWSKPREAAGLGPGEGKHVTVHSIRHLHASIMLNAGMSMYELSTRLGHESIDVTIRTYSHFLPDTHFRGAEHAAKALGEMPELVVD